MLVIVTVSGFLLGIFLKLDKNDEKDKTNHTHLAVDELLVRDILDGTKVDDIINDPEWEANVVDSTENYVMVDSDKFDFSQKIGVEDGYTNIYFNTDSREIEMIQHNYVTYTNNLIRKRNFRTW